MRPVHLIATASILALANCPIPPAEPQALGLLSGQLAHDRVTKLTSQVHWHNSLYQAEDVARREGKMVLWLHMLGDIKGDT
ncbi:MAG: hypothetical protein C5B53_03275 [Candidatus Melainabacteria bacterium]|nr:MAG: hypothetical protein C5B53_03275 [Candidatus Melainabacteria bacterium]